MITISIALLFTVVRDDVSAFRSTILQQPLQQSHRILRNTAIDIAEETGRDIASFQEWASYGGIQTTDGFQLVGEELDGHLDVSAMTTQAISADSTVVYVPNDMILSSSSAMNEFGQLKEAEELLEPRRKFI
jgi:hypothetical protein